jgi:hypothetical protein
MAAIFSDTALDKLLDYIATATIMTACSAEADTYTEMATTFALADVVLAGGDFTKANGDTSGRKVTRAAKTGVTVDTSGTATHVSYGISSGSVWICTVPCNSTVLTGAGTVDFGAHKFTVPDPA